MCVGYAAPSIDISWSFNGETLRNSSLVTIFKENSVGSQGVFQQSFLQLCNRQSYDVGDYTCTVSNALTTANSSISLAVEGVSGKSITIMVFLLQAQQIFLQVTK